MIRQFTMTVTDGYIESPVTLNVTIDDTRYGLDLEIDGRSYTLDSGNISDLKDILSQVEIDPSN